MSQVFLQMNLKLTESLSSKELKMKFLMYENIINGNNYPIVIYAASLDSYGNILYDSVTNQLGLARDIEVWREISQNTSTIYKDMIYSNENEELVSCYGFMLTLHFNFRNDDLSWIYPIIEDTYTFQEGFYNNVEVVQNDIPETFWEPVSCKLSKDDFNKLTRRVMGKKLKKELKNDDVNCVICQEEICSRQHCIILHCKHIFHKKCAFDWLTKHCQTPSCPYCREDVRNNIE
jgi:hypothetical protein